MSRYVKIVIRVCSASLPSGAFSVRSSYCRYGTHVSTEMMCPDPQQSYFHYHFYICSRSGLCRIGVQPGYLFLVV